MGWEAIARIGSRAVGLAVLVSLIVPAAAAAKSDVLLLLDTTGSMSDALSQATERVYQMTEDIDSRLSDVAYAVGEVRDYPIDEFDGEPGEVPFNVAQPITTDHDAIYDALMGLDATGGGDSPEAYGTALREAALGATVGWRPGARRMVILVSDDMPHDDDLNEGVPKEIWIQESPYDTIVDPGPDEVIGTADDVDWQETLDHLVDQGIPLMYVLFEGDESYLPYWEHWAGLTGGEAVTSDSYDLADTVVDLVERGATVDLPECPAGEGRDSLGRCRHLGPPCPDVLVIGARGSGESPFTVGRPLRIFSKLLAQQATDRGKELLVQPLRYPAVGVGASHWRRAVNSVDAFLGTPFRPYRKSVAKGAERLRLTLRNRISACRGKSTRVVLAGYSQGAQVVGDGLAAALDGLDTELREKVAAVVLFADPRFNNSDRAVVRGNPHPGSKGVLGRREVFPADPRVFSICREKDVLCGNGLGGLGPHSEYHRADKGRFEVHWAVNWATSRLFGASGAVEATVGMPDSADLGKGLPYSIEVREPADGGTPVTIHMEAELQYGGFFWNVDWRPHVSRVFRAPGRESGVLGMPRRKIAERRAASPLRLPTRGGGRPPAVRITTYASRAGKHETRDTDVRTVDSR